MRVKQNSSSRLWLSEESSLDAQVTIELDVPYEGVGPGGGVDIHLPWNLFEHLFPESALYNVSTRLFNAVHAGIGYFDGPIPSGGIEVRIVDLSVEPLDFVTGITDETRRTELMAGVIEGLIFGTVAAMFSAIDQLEVI